MQLLKLQNVKGHGDIISYVTETLTMNLNVKLGDYVIKDLMPFGVDVQSYVKGVTTKNEYLVLNVESFTTDSIELSLMDSFIFDINDRLSIVGENILLHQSSIRGAYTIYNLNTGEALYKTANGAIFMDKFHGSANSIVLIFTGFNMRLLVSIKDGKLNQVTTNLEGAYRSIDSSDDLFAVELKGEDTCYLIGFDKDTDRFVLLDTFDLFINNISTENAFALKENRLYLYNKSTRTAKVIRDFGEDSFTINPLSSNAISYPVKDHTIISNNEGIYCVDLPIISATCGNNTELINNDGSTIESSIKRFTSLKPYILSNNSGNYVGYIKTDGTCWMYDVCSNLKFKLDIFEDDLKSDLIYSTCFTKYELVKMAESILCSEGISEDFLTSDTDYLWEKNMIFEFSDYSQYPFKETPIILLPKEHGVTVHYLNDNELVTLSDDSGKPTVFGGFYRYPSNDIFVALEMKSNFEDVVGEFDTFDLDNFLNSVLKCTLISLENEKYELDDIELEDFKRFINFELDEYKLEILDYLNSSN